MKCNYRQIFVCVILSIYVTQLLPTPFRAKYDHVPADTTFEKKRCTILLYGAARNDLQPFIERNLVQLMQVGSNGDVTFLAHVDIFGPGRKKQTQRFIIFKNKLTQVGSDMQMDSGDPATLVDSCLWAYQHFPAENNILILWNHGTGDLEPLRGKAINPSELYHYNPQTKLIELNRSIGFLDYLDSQPETPEIRGICFDEATGHFLTNHQVGEALRYVCNTCFNGKPFDTICCDACLMMGIGFMYSIKPYGQKPLTRYLIGSQEVVLATGYPYIQMFTPLATHAMPFEEFSEHVTGTFADAYSKVTGDYCQSALNMEDMDPLYESVDRIAGLLIEGLQNQKNSSVRNLIKKSSSSRNCTTFEEPSYKDLNHLLTNMQDTISSIELSTKEATSLFKDRLTREINTCKAVIDHVVIANAAGSSLKEAKGISIYVPEKKMHPSYQHTDFAHNNRWYTMLKTYLAS
jgi:hypothetical protein